MNLTRLEYFSVIAECGSMRRASELLHVSPAALSKAMKQLEHEVGFTLFVPSGRGLVLSNRGAQLARALHPLLAKLPQVISSVRDAGERARTGVRVGSYEFFSTHLLG